MSRLARLSGGGMPTPHRLRRSCAAWLRRLAQRLDRQPEVTSLGPLGGWIVDFHGVPLAEIGPGQIRDTRRQVPVATAQPPGDRLVIRVRSHGLSRGKYAAAAVHAALLHLGVHPGAPVIVLGGKAEELEAMTTHVRDAGRTEVAPGTLTAAAEWDA